MNPRLPSSLPSDALARRLGELVSDERRVQVEFLLHLDEFDRRRAYLEAGYGSLWDFCLAALHLREGAAGRRIGAMRVLRRFPRLEGALRDGRLCLSTLALLGQVLTDENMDDLLYRAAYRTKAEVDHLVASVRPRQAPREGVRKLPKSSEASPQPPAPAAATTASDMSELRSPAPEIDPAPATLALDAVEAPRPRAVEVRAVSEGQWSLRATIDRACKEDLERLSMLLSHKLPGADLSAVLHEAIRCGLEKHGKRRGAVKPERPQAKRGTGRKDPSAIPADVRRRVWERDGGSCTWEGSGGRRCCSRWQVEVDHVLPLSRGGASTEDNLRLLCRKHNLLHAERVHGRWFMARFRKEEATISRDSATAPP